MTHGMVCAPQPEAVEAGTDVLRKGGNAVDASIACALVQTAVDPLMCGIAGFGSMHLYLPGMSVYSCLNFHARGPAAARENMWADLIEAECEDGFGFILEGRVNEVGYQSIATPESLRAFAVSLARFGTMTLKELLDPAIAYAEDGFLIRPHVHRFWTQVEPAGRVDHIEYLRASPAAAGIYLTEAGDIREAGGILRNPDMAASLRRIAEEGVEAFYEGQIAEAIVADMDRNGGLLTLADLKNAEPEETEPLWGDYRGFRIAANPPPGGGVMVLEMLNILENFDLAGMGHNSPDYIAAVAEAMKIATVDKDRHVGDPRFVDVPLERLIAHVPRLQKGADQRDTTHVCAIDDAGNCVTMTHSLGMPSGVVTEGLGFMYNGCMSVFDPRLGNTGSLAPGKARFTAMAPTIVFEEAQPLLLIGAPGGTYITMGVLQGILNVLDFGMDAQQAVSAPRFSATSDIIEITNRLPHSVDAALRNRGYDVRRYALSYHFAGVHAIRIRDGRWDGGADPGRDGMALEA